jgi:hypothetical protein
VTWHELVKVPALPSETSAQKAAEKVPVPAPERVKSTDPAGSDWLPPPVSVTVAVQSESWPIVRGSWQSTTVEVGRCVTVSAKVPLLEACTVLDASS